ncbi:MAG: GDSL-type esterase/lipase family protein [Myxococcota bacterium]
MGIDNDGSMGMTDARFEARPRATWLGLVAVLGMGCAGSGDDNGATFGIGDSPGGGGTDGPMDGGAGSDDESGDDWDEPEDPVPGDTGADDGDAPPGDSGDPTGDPPPNDPSGDPPPAGACQPTPERMVIFGDSIAACQGVGGTDSPDCAPKRFHSLYNESFFPTTYENLAVSGAKTADVVSDQIPAMQTGVPGHVFVVIYVGGNDLSPSLLMSDEMAQANFQSLSAELAAHWEQIFAFLEDPANFPDGVTLLMNSQYDPFDKCTSSPYNISQTKLELLVEYNVAMEGRAEAHEYAWLADQHAPFLGHGHHADAPECPFYEAGSAGWMNDLIHPNEAGHGNIADVMAGVAATMYEGCAE